MHVEIPFTSTQMHDKASATAGERNGSGCARLAGLLTQPQSVNLHAGPQSSAMADRSSQAKAAHDATIRTREVPTRAKRPSLGADKRQEATGAGADAHVDHAEVVHRRQEVKAAVEVDICQDHLPGP